MSLLMQILFVFILCVNLANLHKINNIKHDDALRKVVVGKGNSTRVHKVHKVELIHKSHEFGSKPFLESVQSRLVEIQKLISKLVEKLFSKLPEINEEFQKILKSLNDRVSNTLARVNNQLRITGVDIVNDILNRIQFQLWQLLSEFQTLALILDADFHYSLMYLNETIMNHSSKIDNWSSDIKRELRDVNNTCLYNEGCKVIEDFIKYSTEQLQTCCNISIRPMRLLCGKVGSMIAESTRVLVDSLDKIQTCIEDKRSYKQFMLNCLTVAYDEIIIATKKAIRLRHKITKLLPLKFLYSKCCISVILVEMEQYHKDTDNESDK